MDTLSFLPSYAHLRHRATGAVFAIACRLPGIAVGYAQAAIDERLTRLQNDVDAALRYIASLPADGQARAAEEFFDSFFTDPLPKRFIHHFIYGKGTPLVLGEADMVALNPYVNAMRCPTLRDRIAADAGPWPRSETLDVRCPSVALTNGTLGQFTTHMKGGFTISAKGAWTFAGRMSFHDEWDFDPKDFSTGGRSLQGEIKTRFANSTLPGQGFKVTSVDVDFSQGSGDETVVWVGGKPKAVPDRIAAADVELGSMESASP
jgi:hypothetical protein